MIKPISPTKVKIEDVDYSPAHKKAKLDNSKSSLTNGMHVKCLPERQLIYLLILINTFEKLINKFLLFSS